MTLKDELINCLQNLLDIDYTNRVNARKGDAIAERVLNLIYQIGIQQMTFTDEEKNYLGPLLANAIKPFKINIESTACAYRTRLNNSILIKRSALQFLIDNYSQFSVGSLNLTTTLQDVNIVESIEILDNLINELYDLNNSDEGSSDRESVGSKNVPPSHIWWSY